MQSQKYYPHIDGLRGIAVLMIVAVHLFDHDMLSAHTPYFAATSGLLRLGEYGVPLFFLISASCLYRFSRHRTPTDFYLRRAIRILPAWWVAIFLYARLRGVDLQDALPHYFMYFGITRYEARDLFDAEWSTFVEETFYLAFPWLLSLYADERKARILFILGYVVAFVWLPYCNWIGVDRDYGRFFPIYHWFIFSLGICLVRAPTLHSRAIEIAAVAAVILFSRCGYLLVVPALAVIFHCAGSEKTFIGRAARSTSLRRFGKYSYGIYLFHLAAIELLAPYRAGLFHGWSLESAFLVAFPITALTCLGVGALSYHLIERPSMALSNGARNGMRGVSRLLRSPPTRNVG